MGYGSEQTVSKRINKSSWEILQKVVTIRETLTRITLRFHLTLGRMSKSQKTADKEPWWGCGQGGAPTHHWGGLQTCRSYRGNQCGEPSKSTKINLLLGMGLNILLHRYLFSHVHGGCVLGMSFSWWVDNEKIVCVWNGISFILKNGIVKSKKINKGN